MNCRHAQDELLAPRDTPLGVAGSSALQAHLSECAECRALQQQLLHATAAWLETDAQIKVPDAQSEWHAVRRRSRRAKANSLSSAYGWWQRALQVAAPLTAVAAIAFVLWEIRQDSPEASIEHPTPATSIAATEVTAIAPTEDPWAEFADHFAYASNVEYVETENEDASPFVYVDDESGWLIVWASAPPENASI